MPAAQPPALWLSAAATAVCAVTVVAMAISDGPRRPLTFAGAVLLPGGPPSAIAPAAPGATPTSRPSVSPTRPRASASRSIISSPAPGTAGYQPSMPAVIPAQNDPTRIETPTAAAPSSSAAVAGPASRPSTRPNTPRTGAPSAPSAPSGQTSSSALAQALFTALNDARQRAGLPALNWSAELQRSAAGHNKQMASANELAFRIGDEPALGVRQANQGLLASFAAENVASTQATGLVGVLAAQEQMLTAQPPEDTRRQNLLSPVLDAVGIDVLIDPAHGRIWITQDFARLDGAAAG